MSDFETWWKTSKYTQVAYGENRQVALDAWNAAIALMRGQSERVLIAHAVASDLAALHAVPALSRTMMTIRCSADPVADRKVPIYVFPPEKPKDPADEQ